MAHMIENNMLAYKGETPWHGLGVNVTADMTGDEMLKAAGMEWPVECRKMLLTASNVSSVGASAKALDEYRAITRGDNGRVFQVASRIYKPVQHIGPDNVSDELGRLRIGSMISGGTMQDAKDSFRYHVAQLTWDGDSEESDIPMDNQQIAQFRFWVRFQKAYKYAHETLEMTDVEAHQWACNPQNTAFLNCALAANAHSAAT